MWRADPLQPADPALSHSSGTLDPPQGVEGTEYPTARPRASWGRCEPGGTAAGEDQPGVAGRNAGAATGRLRSRTGSGGPTRVAHEVGRRAPRRRPRRVVPRGRRTPLLVPSVSTSSTRTKTKDASDQYRPVPPQVDLPALEREVLDFWREQKIFEKSVARNEGADRPGPSTRARPRPTAAPAPTTSSRGRSRTSSRGSAPCRATRSTARAAGTATACPSSSPSRRSSGSPARPTSRPSASRSSTRAAASRCSATWTCGSR